MPNKGKVGGEAPLVSVIVPVYNVAKTLPACVESLVWQPYQNVEIILVNDGSTDQSGEICDEWARSDQRVKVIHQANGGLSCARNAGLDAATGEIIAFVDSDDWISTDFFEKNVPHFEQKEVDIVVTNLSYARERRIERPLLHEKQRRVIHDEKERASLLFSREIPSLCMLLYRRKMWEGLRFTPGVYFEDSLIAPSLSARANCIYVSGEGAYVYYQREDSITHSPWSDQKVRDYLQATWSVVEYLYKVRSPRFFLRYTVSLYDFTQPLISRLPKEECRELFRRFMSLKVRHLDIWRQPGLRFKHRLFLTAFRLPFCLVWSGVSMVRALRLGSQHG